MTPSQLQLQGKAANVTDLQKRSQDFDLLNIYCLQVLVWVKHHKGIGNTYIINTNQPQQEPKRSKLQSF